MSPHTYWNVMCNSDDERRKECSTVKYEAHTHTHTHGIRKRDETKCSSHMSVSLAVYRIEQKDIARHIYL